MALGYLERKTSVKGKERLEGTLIQVAAAAAQAVTWVSKDNFSVEEGGLVLYGQCCVLYPFRLLLDVSRRLEDPRQRVL